MTIGSGPLVHRWELTDLQFKVVCEDHRLGGLPRPFTFTSRIRYADDYEAAKSEVRAGLARLADPDFDMLIRALAKPDLMVVAHVWSECAPTDPRPYIKVHATCRGARAYVVTQRMGETISHSGGFDIAESTPAAVARAVVGVLPEVAANGGAETGGAETSARESGATASESRAPRPDVGMIKVIQGHLGFRTPGIIHVGLAWRDIPGDGRYVVRGPGQPVTGMAAPAMVQWIDDRMAEIMLRLQA